VVLRGYSCSCHNNGIGRLVLLIDDIMTLHNYTLKNEERIGNDMLMEYVKGSNSVFYTFIEGVYYVMATTQFLMEYFYGCVMESKYSG